MICNRCNKEFDNNENKCPYCTLRSAKNVQRLLLCLLVLAVTAIVFLAVVFVRIKQEIEIKDKECSNALAALKQAKIDEKEKIQQIKDNSNDTSRINEFLTDL